MTTKHLVGCILFFTISLSACGEPKSSAAAESASLMSEIKKAGAAKVIQHMWGKPEWTKLTTHVASGQKEWVDVATALGASTDGGATEELRDAVFEGLGRNPQYILEALPLHDSNLQSISLSGVCSGRSDPLETYAAAIAEIHRAQSAVEKIQDGKLTEKRALCLRALAKGADDLKRFFGSSP